MSNKKLKNSIIYLEIFGFAVVILLQWSLELYDLLPFFSGGSPTPVNWPEAGAESVAVLIVATIVIIWSRRALMRIRHLEELLHVCSHCKRIKTDDEWINIEEYLLDKTETRLSHGICADCLAKYYPDLIDSPVKTEIPPKN